MHYERRILRELRACIDTPEIVVVTGMRRVGKTTALRMIYDEIPSRNKAFIDIENPIDQRIFEEKDFNNIWANLQAYGISAREMPISFSMRSRPCPTSSRPSNIFTTTLPTAPLRRRRSNSSLPAPAATI